MSNQCGALSVSEFLQSVKTTAHELVGLIDTPLANEDLTLHILNGLGGVPDGAIFAGEYQWYHMIFHY